MLNDLLCRLIRHRIDRHRVWNDGIDFRTQCARCGTPLLRDYTGWREFDEEYDSGPERAAHPHEQA